MNPPTRMIKTLLLTLVLPLATIPVFVSGTHGFFCNSPASNCGGDPPCSQSRGNPTWSGYEISLLDCGGINKNIRSAEAMWYVPSVSQPPSGQASCGSEPSCGFAVWVGLEDMVQASDNNLVQAGTEATWQCGLVSCSFAYQAFYQLGAQTPQQYFSCSIYSGDLVSIDVTWNSSATTNNYLVSIVDIVHSCVNNIWGTYNMSPLWAAFIAERTTYCISGYCAFQALPTFTTFNIYQCNIDAANHYPNDFSTYNCANPSLGPVRELMGNPNTSTNLNINVSPISSYCYDAGAFCSGNFTETWLNSNGT